MDDVHGWAVRACAACVQLHDMVAWRSEGTYLAPGYFLGLDYTAREVVWVVRGTRQVRVGVVGGQRGCGACWRAAHRIGSGLCAARHRLVLRRWPTC